MGQPAIRAVGTGATATSGITLPIPAGTQDGDLMLAFVSSHRGGTTPLGWSVAFTHDHTSSGFPACRIFYRIKQTGDGNPQVNTGDILHRIAGAIISIYNYNPLNLFNFNGHYDSSAGTGICQTNDLTPLSVGELIFFAGFLSDSNDRTDHLDSGYSGTNPTFTEHFDIGSAGIAGSVESSATMAVASGFSTGTSALGARTASITVTNANATGVLFGVQTSPDSLMRGIA